MGNNFFGLLIKEAKKWFMEGNIGSEVWRISRRL
jgi:hypothetical protein